MTHTKGGCKGTLLLLDADSHYSMLLTFTHGSNHIYAELLRPLKQSNERGLAL